MSSSLSVQKAISMNNQGVMYFESGHYDHAREMFTHALESIKKGIADQKTTVTDDNSSGSNNGFKWSDNAPLHTELGLPVPAGSSFIFRRALIVVPVVTNGDENGNNADLAEESTAIIYNLALSCLVSGFLNNNSKLLSTSQKFFEIVLAVRQQKHKCAGNKLSSEMLLDAAICNNLGWIHSEFCNYGVARGYFQEVSSCLTTLSQFGQVNQQDCEGFITNLILDSHPQLAAAA